MSRISHKECQNVEYKRSWQNEDLKRICGFANAQGTTMFFGVDDNQTVVGLKQTKKDLLLFGKDVTKEITDRQRIILSMVKENSFVTITEMSLKTGVVIRTIKRDVQSLQNLGLLACEGGRKDGLWVVFDE